MVKKEFDVKAFRERWGLTQVQLAKKLHMSNHAVSRWENGHAHPQRSSIRLLKILERKLIQKEKREIKENEKKQRLIAEEASRENGG
jgi:ribosome-binding protein aMBF1 (putative translation factor)